MKSLLIMIAAAALVPGPSIGQVAGHRTKSGCISVDGKSAVTVTGRLTVQLFPGPPNYESIAAGDAEERPFIIELPTQACIDDGGNFADPKSHFDRAQVSSSDAALVKVLHAAVGKMVTVTGDGFGAETGHHHAPLVVLAKRITVR